MASSDSLAVFTPLHNEPPAASAARLDTRNSHPVLDCGAASNISAVFTSVMPRHYDGGGITVYHSFAMSSATSACVDLQGAFERIGSNHLDIDADSFAAACTLADYPVPGTSGCVMTASWAYSNGADIDSIVAGDPFRFKLTRRGTTDGATGDMETVTIELKET